MHTLINQRKKTTLMPTNFLSSPSNVKFRLIKAKKITPAIILENGHFLITTEEVELFNSKKISDVKE